MPASLDLGWNLTDLLSAIGLVGKTYWPIIAIFSALYVGFYFLDRLQEFLPSGPRKTGYTDRRGYKRDRYGNRIHSGDAKWRRDVAEVGRKFRAGEL